MPLPPPAKIRVKTAVVSSPDIRVLLLRPRGWFSGASASTPSAWTPSAWTPSAWSFRWSIILSIIVLLLRGRSSTAADLRGRWSSSVCAESFAALTEMRAVLIAACSLDATACAARLPRCFCQSGSSFNGNFDLMSLNGSYD